MEADPQSFGALVGKGAHVDILLEAALLHYLHRQPAEVVQGVGQLDIQ